jgi:chemotaxis protein methyltransferase CheR
VTLTLSPSVFAILSGLVEERAGLHYGPEDRELFAEKVSVRAIELGFESLLDYYYLLRYDPAGEAELARLIDTLVVNETYFFREREQLEWLVDQVLVPHAARSERRLRVWSAACATGEEPITLAMLLADRGCADRVELVASDISGRALERARAGLFSARSLRHTVHPELAARYLEERPGGLRVSAALAAEIDWRQVNLTRTDQVTALGRFDAVLCRNVLIYFSDDTAERVISGLTARLDDDGVLLVGVSESLLRFGTAVRCEEQGGVFYYRPVRL